MDGCSRQDPAYRPAKGRAPARGSFLFPVAATCCARGAVAAWPAGAWEGAQIARSGARSFTFALTPPHKGLGGAGLGEKVGNRGLMRSATRKKKTAGDAYCPHCHLLIERKVGDEWPEEPQRCPHCRLLVGIGRARPTPSAEPGARGSAAGVFAHEAKRAGGDEETSPRRTSARRSATWPTRSASRPERLLMVDYQQRASDDDSLPGLSAVFAAYGSWKRARRAAAGTA